MQLHEARSFNHDEKDYKVCFWTDGDYVKIRAFKKDGKPADTYEYSITTETLVDAVVMKSNTNPFDDIVQIAEASVRKNTLEKYQDTVSYLNNKF